MITAIIPARGGSKGIPKKNIINFYGKPLIAWSIIYALNTPEIDKVFVSSDSNEILDISRKYGAHIIKRPIKISGDTSPSEEAIQHAIMTVEPNAKIIVMLQPTSPLRKPNDLSNAIKQFKKNKLDSMFSGSKLEDFLIWEKNNLGHLSSFNYDFNNRSRRQDRIPQYVENGSFYIFKSNIITNYNNRLGGKIGIYLMDFWQTFEIDTFEDIDIVKFFFHKKIKHTYQEKIATISI